MEPGATIARVVAGLSAAGLAGTGLAAMLIPKLRLSSGMSVASYTASALLLLCCGLFLFAMLWGLHTDWSERAKAAMTLGGLAAVPAAAGLLLFLLAGIVGKGSWAIKAYFIALGLIGALVLAIPALVIIIMIMPGKP